MRRDRSQRRSAHPSGAHSPKSTRRAPKSFVAQVLKAANRAGGVVTRGRLGKLKRSTFGRGRGRAFAAERGLFSSARRVVVKTRVVRHKGQDFRSAPLATHVAYLRREGVTRDEQKARLFDARSDTVDAAAFVDQCKDDRHHFRFIVSPEDATEMEDMRAFTRDLLREAERDLGTKLDWVGVEHWNTDNPHIHILLRGKADDGADLIISRDYISNGMRARAEHLVGLELGPKPERRIHEDLAREVDADRWTRLDRTISAGADETGIVDMRPGARANRSKHRATQNRPSAEIGAAWSRFPSWPGAMDAGGRRREPIARPWPARRHHQDHAPSLDRSAHRAMHDRFCDPRGE